MRKPAINDPVTRGQVPDGMAAPVREVTRSGVGRAVIYRLNPPMNGNEHVMVSAVERADGGCETLIFPANQHRVTDFMQLPGSRMNVLDHATMLAGAGYVIALEGEDQ